MTTVESNVHFREHDIEFLQKRTRAWLQAVLDERFEDQRSLGELVADGNILSRVAKYIVKDMTGRSPGPELYSPKAFSEAAVQGKNSGKYLPYSNVDSFLKMCRKVGLNDVDLFTPPDAVEGKDIRRVCVAVRALARKARAQHIRVPDFDDLSRPLPMPKERVGVILDHLEHASSSPPVLTPTAPSPDLDIQKSDRVQIISKFLSSTKKSPLGISETSMPVFSSEPPSSDSTSPVAPVTPGPAAQDPRSKLSPPSTPVATLPGLRTPTLKTTLSAPVQPLSSSFNFAPEPTPSPLFKPEWVPLELDLDDLLDLSEEVASPLSPSPSPQVVAAETEPEERLPAQPREWEPSTKTSNSEALSMTHPPQLERSEPKSNESDSKLQSSNPSTTLSEFPSRDSAVTRSEAKDTAVKVSRPASANRPPPSRKEPAESSKPIQIHVNLRIWAPVIAGVVAFVGTLLAVRVRDPVVYEVQAGDTLTKISKKAGKSTWEELVRLNPNIKNPNLIYPSERLRLPV